VIGLAAVFAVVRLVQSQLFGVQPYDPATLAGATLLSVLDGVCRRPS